MRLRPAHHMRLQNFDQTLTKTWEGSHSPVAFLIFLHSVIHVARRGSYLDEQEAPRSIMGRRMTSPWNLIDGPLCCHKLRSNQCTGPSACGRMSRKWFKMHFSNFYNRSLKGMLLLFIDSLWYNPWDIIQSYLLDLKVFVYSMQLVSNCYNFGLITEKHWCSYKGHYIPLAMTAACSRIEINPTMPVTPTVSLSYNYTTVITELCSNHV